MKNTLFLIPLLILSAVLPGQTAEETTSSFGLLYPVKREIQRIGSAADFSVDVMRVTSQTNDEVKWYCRITTSEIHKIGYLSSDLKSFTVLLEEPSVQKLYDKLETYFLIGKQEKPKVYNDYLDFVRDYLGRQIPIQFYNPEVGDFWNADAWTLEIDADTNFNQGRAKIGTSKLPKLAQLLKTAMELMK